MAPLGLTCRWAPLPAVERSCWLRRPRCSARRTSSCSWRHQYCSRALRSFSRASGCNTQLVRGPGTLSPPGLGSGWEPRAPPDTGLPHPWGSMAELSEAADLVVDGKIIPMLLLRVPSLLLAPSNAWILWSHLAPGSHLPLGRAGGRTAAGNRSHPLRSPLHTHL